MWRRPIRWAARGIGGAHARATDEFDLPLGEVTCPPLVSQRGGGRVECTSTVQGVEIAFEVKMGEDSVDFEPTRGVVMAVGVERLMTDALAERGVAIEADCGPGLRVSVPGSAFTCTARDAQGQARSTSV